MYLKRNGIQEPSRIVQDVQTTHILHNILVALEYSIVLALNASPSIYGISPKTKPRDHNYRTST